MISEQTVSTQVLHNLISPVAVHEKPFSYLEQEYNTWKSLFAEQPQAIQRFLEDQARCIADSILQGVHQVRFLLPESVVVEVADREEQKEFSLSVLPSEREIKIGSWRDRLLRHDLTLALRQQLSAMETSPFLAVAVSAGLIRYALAHEMVDLMLAAGRPVTYVSEKDEEIPSIPVDRPTPSSLLANSAVEIMKSEEQASREACSESHKLFAPVANRFYLPQWVAFDNQDQLLAGAIGEAEAGLAAMQRYLKILDIAVAIGSFIVADEAYQQKRYGILGQIVNQGRAQARYLTKEIIQRLERRISLNTLNRGLSLSLPYFDDRTMEMKTYDFTVIPRGIVMFNPAFIVRVASEEQVKVAQNMYLSPSTRKHLLSELETLEEAFDPDLE